MRAVVQRVREASVRVDGQLIAQIGVGLLVLLGVTTEDRAEDADWMADKLLGLRIFENVVGRFDRSVVDVSGDVLLVSQFTLCADTRKGRRPSFASAAPPDRAEPLFHRVVARLERNGIPVETGRFGAKMEVCLVNDGPVTIVVDGPQ